MILKCSLALFIFLCYSIEHHTEPVFPRIHLGKIRSGLNLNFFECIKETPAYLFLFCLYGSCWGLATSNFIAVQTYHTSLSPFLRMLEFLLVVYSIPKYIIKFQFTHNLLIISWHICIFQKKKKKKRSLPCVSHSPRSDFGIKNWISHFCNPYHLTGIPRTLP